ncbi:hypothetical protein ACFX10_015697 [Malus domestica]
MAGGWGLGTWGGCGLLEHRLFLGFSSGGFHSFATTIAFSSSSELADNSPSSTMFVPPRLNPDSPSLNSIRGAVECQTQLKTEFFHF